MLFADNMEFYQYLLDNPKITLSLRWYNDFGSIDFIDFSKDKKFQEVHISNINGSEAYDIVFNNMSFVYLLDEDFEEIIEEAYQIQREYFKRTGWNVEKYFPAADRITLNLYDLKIRETFFLKDGRKI